MCNTAQILRGVRSILAAGAGAAAMRSPSRLRARIEALELALKPKARIFVFFHVDDGAVSYEEREAAFRAEKGVGPGDELHSVRITFDGPGE